MDSIDSESDRHHPDFFKIGSRACNQLFADTGCVSEQLPTGDLTYDMAQMTFHDRLDQPFLLLLRFAQELVNGELDVRCIWSHPDLNLRLECASNAITCREML